MWETTAIEQGGVQHGTQIGDAIAVRESVFAMTDEAETAVLRPADPGAWPHALRVALASRIARLSNLSELADRYARLIDSPDYQPITNLDNNGSALGLESVVDFMDKVASRPRDITDADIKTLQSVGVTDADIVRLSELNAFMAYQIRLVTGLAMLTGSST